MDRGETRVNHSHIRLERNKGKKPNSSVITARNLIAQLRRVIDFIFFHQITNSREEQNQLP